MEKNDLLSKPSLPHAPNEPGPLEEQQEEKISPTVKKLVAEEKQAKKNKKVLKVATKIKGEERVTIGPKEYDRIVIPDSEDDPHWDPKLRNPVPEGLIHGLAEFGWDPSMAGVVIREGKDQLKIVHGKTRWRALEKANKLRKAEGKDPIEAHFLIVDETADDIESVIFNMRRNTRLNRQVQEIDPMTLAESIVRSLSAGIEEKQVAQDHAVSVNDLHGYLLITDEDKCPPKVQELLRNGDISFAAALELARRAGNMTKGELTQSAEQIAKAAAGGVRITSAQVKKAAGVGDDHPATQKERKQFVLDLHSSDLHGKIGDAVKWAAIVATEIGLGTRSVDSAWKALDQIAKGHTIRVDFKQYQDGNAAKEPEKAVKGQAAKK